MQMKEQSLHKILYQMWCTDTACSKRLFWEKNQSVRFGKCCSNELHRNMIDTLGFSLIEGNFNPKQFIHVSLCSSVLWASPTAILLRLSFEDRKLFTSHKHNTNSEASKKLNTRYTKLCVESPMDILITRRCFWIPKLKFLRTPRCFFQLAHSIQSPERKDCTHLNNVVKSIVCSIVFFCSNRIFFVHKFDQLFCQRFRWLFSSD